MLSCPRAPLGRLTHWRPNPNSGKTFQQTRTWWPLEASTIYVPYGQAGMYIAEAQRDRLQTHDHVARSNFERNAVLYENEATGSVAAITQNGRRRTALISTEECRSLRRRKPRVIGPGEVPEG